MGPGSSRVRRSLRWYWRRALEVARGRRGADDGMTLVELTVTLAILGVVFGITFGLIIGIEQQQVNTLDTINGSQQEQIASQEVIQYLRAAVTPSTAAVLTSSTLTLPVLSGEPSGTNTFYQDAVTMTYQVGKTNDTGTLKVTYQSHSGTSRILGTYYVLAPTGSIFTYYDYIPGQSGSLQAMAFQGGSIPSCAYWKIAAVGINVSFFANPEDLPTRGYAADIATTLSTTVFLRNSDGFLGDTTTTAPSSPTTTCPD